MKLPLFGPGSPLELKAAAVSVLVHAILPVAWTAWLLARIDAEWGEMDFFTVGSALALAYVLISLAAFVGLARRQAWGYWLGVFWFILMAGYQSILVAKIWSHQLPTSLVVSTAASILTLVLLLSRRSARAVRDFRY